MFGLEPLASRARPHEILHLASHVGEVEIPAQAVKSAVYALVPVVMDGSHDLLQQGRRRGNVQAPVVGDHAVNHPPRCSAGQGRVHGLCLAKARDEGEAGCRDRQQLALLRVAAGQRIRNDVRGARPALHSKIEAQ
jgi:hypothetical protein